MATEAGSADPDKLHVAAVGGGHGLAATIRAARRYARRVTAVVSTADDGGSTGRLRSGLPLPAP
ncbi:MAG TPA: 2-phospho-L-lactate transferase CofD family protein, partial [Actinomycetes bacterium]|nr:2-phospho-L-lactate transferase CofD family protein [Actinomycetes bacterium]